LEQAIQQYLATVEANLKAGDATEHSYLPAFKQLLDDFISGLPHSGSNEVEKLRYADVWFSADQCFSGIEEAGWNFQIVGYQVLAKWLKDWKRRTLSFDEIEHYQKVVVAIHETRHLMHNIDSAIPDWQRV